MPCLNEERTVHECVTKAAGWLRENALAGEVLLADNGSTDRSRERAQAAGARVIEVSRRGYGSALQAGIRASRGNFVIMGDADSSYDFSNLTGFLVKLREGQALVIGNRFKGGIAPGAMPFLHRYFGTRLLSSLGRLLFPNPCHDGQCGLRGFRRDAILALELQCPGMEYATEMIIRAAQHRLAMVEIPVALAKDGRDRPSHLRTWPDGWRNLLLLLLTWCKPRATS